ncbi:MAG: hypothetical protein ACAI43_27505 [Phycisphaerae bacterium]|nr:hypothetical protein [Tepidisphaeraceae bacterium]
MADGERLGVLKQIEELKTQVPFSPFLIVLSSGDRYLIEAPANLVEMKSELFYAFPGGDRFVLIRINQITAVERPEARRQGHRRKVS